MQVFCAKQWQAAYKEEIEGPCVNNKVWDLVPYDQCQWVISNQVTTMCLQDHLTVCGGQGFAQKPGIDYTDTYAPVACMESTWSYYILAHLWTGRYTRWTSKWLFSMASQGGSLYGATRRLGMLHAQNTLWD